VGGWQPFHCIKAVVEGQASQRRVCRGEHLADLRALLQASLNQLYADCAQLERDVEVSNELCAAARRGRRPPLVPGVPQAASRDFQRMEEESDIEYTQRQLHAVRFHFRDLGLAADESDQAPRVIRERLAELGRLLAEQQVDNTFLLEHAARLAANALHYAPASHVVHAVIGSEAQFGYSYTNPEASWRWVRGHVGLGVKGGFEHVSGTPSPVAFSPAVGVEFQPMFTSNETTQLWFGIGAGLHLGNADKFGFAACPVDPGQRSCSAPLAKAYTALSLFDLIRMQLTFAYALPVAGRQSHYIASPGVGVQFSF
jgi:hypothetical protein